MPTPIPFPVVDLIDPVTKQIRPEWQNYFLSLNNVSLQAAPVDAQYLVSTPTADLTNERNLGALATGFLFITVAAGIAVPTSTLSGALLTNIPASALAAGGSFPAISGTNLTSLTAANISAGGTLPSLDGAALTNLTGANITGGGTYTPTLTNATNVSASTAYPCQYARVGAMVTVSGKVDVDPTAAGATVLGISLPIASNFGNDYELGGVAFAPGIAGQGAGIEAGATNDRANMQWTAVDVTNQSWWFVFQYQVI